MSDLAFTKQDESRAKELQSEIEKALENAKESYARLMRSFARLGNVLLEVRSKYFWRLYGYDTWGAYMASIETQAKKSHTQLHSYITVAEKLNPYLEENQIETMGISKAMELARIPKFFGVAPSKELIEYAINSDITTSELRGEIYKKYQLSEEDKGKYFDLGPVLVTPEQKALILKVFDLAPKVDPPFDISWPDMVIKTQTILRMCEECESSWSQEVQYVGK